MKKKSKQKISSSYMSLPQIFTFEKGRETTIYSPTFSAHSIIQTINILNNHFYLRIPISKDNLNIILMLCTTKLIN